MATVSKAPTELILSEDIPPLENGDHLSRDEFERRYHAMPEVKKAELIEGIVYMGSPVSLERHGRQHFDLITLLGYYQWSTPGVQGADNTTARLDTENEPQPDIMLFIAPSNGGQAKISSDGYLESAPELVVEVASSSVSIDAKIKVEVYRRNSVREYILWRVRDNEIDWFVLKDGQYERMLPDASGIYRSRIFPGLWIDLAALIRGDIPAIRKTLDEGLATPEHQAFVERLQAAQQSAKPADA